jgi:hypothetical protein
VVRVAATILMVTCCARIAYKKGAGMEVELDAFSGRPNPQWNLPPDKASELLSRIGSLPETKVVRLEPALGYRGFLLREGDRSIRVYGGIIQIQEKGITRTHLDTAGLERELATDASRRGYETVVRDVLDKRGPYF